MPKDEFQPVQKKKVGFLSATALSHVRHRGVAPYRNNALSRKWNTVDLFGTMRRVAPKQSITAQHH